jgi:Domain of unknown function (DUF4395)
MADEDVPDCTTQIPRAIVRLNRWTIVVTVVLAFVYRTPLITTALFLVVACAAVFGRRASLIYFVGNAVLRPEPSPDGEDPRLMRFNNALATAMLAIAQLGFLAGVPLIGWTFAGLTALAAAVALAGFCAGCFLFYQFKLNRARLSGRGSPP